MIVIPNPKKTAVYSGHKYELIGTKTNYADAKKEAERIRSHGMGACVKNYGKNAYAIYGRYK